MCFPRLFQDKYSRLETDISNNKPNQQATCFWNKYPIATLSVEFLCFFKRKKYFIYIETNNIDSYSY